MMSELIEMLRQKSNQYLKSRRLHWYIGSMNEHNISSLCCLLETQCPTNEIVIAYPGWIDFKDIVCKFSLRLSSK